MSESDSSQNETNALSLARAHDRKEQKRKETEEAVKISCSSSVFGFIQLQETPYKMEVIRLGFDREEQKWKDHVNAVGLACLIIAMATVFGYINVIPLLNFGTTETVCRDPLQHTFQYLKIYRNFTRIDEAKIQVTNLTRTINKLYNMSLVDLKSQQIIRWTDSWRNSKLVNCTTCTPNQQLTVTWANFPEPWVPRKSVEVNSEIPANSVDPPNVRLKKFSCNQKRVYDVNVRAKLQFTKFRLIDVPIKLRVPVEFKLVCRHRFQSTTFRNRQIGTFKESPVVETEVNATPEGQNPNVTTNVTAEDYREEAVKYLRELMRRVNIVSSFYCGYVALMIFIGPPLELSSPTFKVKIQTLFASMKRLTFVFIGVLLWFLLDLMQVYIKQLWLNTDLSLIFSFIRVDLCFSDATFLKHLFRQAEVICEEMVKLENQWNVDRQQLSYYQGIELTYSGVAGYEPGYFGGCSNSNCSWNVTSVYYNMTYPTFNYTCDPNKFLQTIKPIEHQTDFTKFVIISGLVAGSVFQLVLANWVSVVFTFFDPLVTYYGKVLVPYGNQETGVRKRALLQEIKQFVRYNAVVPLIFWSTALFLVIYNMAGGDFGVLTKKVTGK